MGAVKAKAKIMIQQSCALILLISTYGAFAQFGCDNNTLPDGSSCPNDGHIDHTYADPEHCSRFFDCYNGWCDEPGRVTCGDRYPDGRPCKDCVGPGPDFDCEAARVDCGDRPVWDNNDENCHDWHITTTTKRPSPCDGVECDHGNDYYPEGICKPCFCQCHDGVQDEICCQPGLVFNPATNTCDWPYNTDGC